MQERTVHYLGQKKRHSLLESLVNVTVGYAVAIAVQLLVFPLFRIQVTLTTNLLIGGIFTFVSILRSYALRRLFNYCHIKGIL